MDSDERRLKENKRFWKGMNTFWCFATIWITQIVITVNLIHG